MKSETYFYAFRLRPHTDLKKSILEFAQENKIHAGTIVSCVGSLEALHLRYADQKQGTIQSGRFEIVSLAGTFSVASAHLHMSVADHLGKTYGGHLLEGNFIYTTAEIVVADLIDLQFDREIDSTYGYHELAVRSRH